MQAQVSLTVSAAKRLIAKGIAEYQPVLEALRTGWVAVAKGSTNAYVVEELTGQRIEKHRYVTGHVVPAGRRGRSEISADLPDLVLHKGDKVDGLNAVEALKEMGPGDVFLKGANALNYEDHLAGILIGHQTGGTIGAALGTVTARRISLIVPVGLEKQVPYNIIDASYLVGPGDDERPKDFPAIWPVYGDVFTEIEAFRELFDVEAYPIAAGGLAGAEGGVWFCLHGEKRSVGDALKMIEEIQDEPPFVDY
jgi:hypothetical protein